MIDQVFARLNTVVPEKWKWILEHGGFKRYFKNTGWMFVGQVCSALSLIVNIWIARYLGPSEFGVLSYVLAFVGMFSFIANMGLSGVIVRDLVKYPEKKDALLGTSAMIMCVGGVIAYVIAIVSSWLLVESWTTRLLIMIFSLTFVFSSLGVIGYYFQATVQAKKNVYAQVVTIIVSSIWKISMIMLGKGIFWIIWAYVFDVVLMGVLFVYFFQKSGSQISRWSIDRMVARELFAASWLLVLSSAASSVYAKIGQVMIGGYLDAHEVGVYSAAVRLVEIWYFVPVIICSSLFPAIINSMQTDREKYIRRLRRLYIFLAGSAVVIAVPTTLLAPWLITLLYGPAYAGAVGVLQIYAWSGIGLFLTLGFNQYFLAENRLRILVGLSLASMCINIVLNIFFIPMYGSSGAAWATLISYSTAPVLVMGITLIKRRKNI